MRLQKFLSAAGICSRRKGEEYIKTRIISVNDHPVTELGTKIDPKKDIVKVKGKIVQLVEKNIYIALNKPEGYISSCKHSDKKIVIDLIKIKERIYPIGRLDKNSEGLLLFTNDGKLHYKLSHPSFNHEKEYLITVQQPISDKSLQKLSKGVFIEKIITKPANIKRISKKSFKIILKEGRNRQIRKMVKTIHNKVIKLKRLRISKINLGNLAKGSWRYLSDEEKRALIPTLHKQR